MAKKLTDEERQKIVDLFETGKSCRQIAKEVGRSHGTVGNIARDVGHVFGRINDIRAREAAAAYGKERRANFIVKLHDECELLREQLHGKYLVYNFGGRNNTYAEKILKEPPVDAKFSIIRSISAAQRTILEILKYDNPQGSVDNFSDFDIWLKEKSGNAGGS